MTRSRYINENHNKFKTVTCAQCGERVTRRQSLAILPKGRLVLGTVLSRRCRKHDGPIPHNASSSN